MALIQCKECGSEVSDKAAVCMRCGAPMTTRANAVPVAAVKEPKTFLWYWWLWGPLGVLLALLLIGLSLPENETRANEFARACREMARGDALAQMECDRAEARIRHNPGPPVAGPAVNTNFVPEPPRAQTQTNEQILSCVISGIGCERPNKGTKAAR